MNPGTVPSRPHREFQTAEQYVYAYLRSRILSGKLRGGARLNQETIARELQVSRMPVREAIKRLDSEGLVVNRPNRGTVVTALGPDAILELFEMRSVLEGLAVSLAIPFFDAGVMDGIEGRLTRLERAQGNLTTWMQRHDELHHHICRLSRRARLVAAVQNLRQTVAPYIRLHISAYTQQLEMPGFEHRTLVSAI